MALTRTMKKGDTNIALQSEVPELLLLAMLSQQNCTVFAVSHHDESIKMYNALKDKTSSMLRIAKTCMIWHLIQDIEYIYDDDDWTTTTTVTMTNLFLIFS